MGVGERKILIVDDDMLMLMALSRAYRGRFLDVTTAESTSYAMTLLDSSSFDLFILHLELNDYSSFELLATIDERFPYIPVILTTATDVKSPELNDQIAAIRKKGYWHLLEKPFPLDLLTSLIEKSLARHEDRLFCNLYNSHEFGEDKRIKRRKAHILPEKLSFEVIRGGKVTRETIKTILTDISDGGVGLLTEMSLEKSQIVSFEGALAGKCGRVSWSAMVEDKTCRAGIHFI
jgi:CheY-like chemotaxis protein